MRIFVVIFFLLVSLSAVLAQNRGQAVEEFNNLRKQGEN